MAAHKEIKSDAVHCTPHDFIIKVDETIANYMYNLSHMWQDKGARCFNVQYRVKHGTEHWIKESIHLKCKQAHVQFETKKKQKKGLLLLNYTFFHFGQS